MESKAVASTSGEAADQNSDGVVMRSRSHFSATELEQTRYCGDLPSAVELFESQKDVTVCSESFYMVRNYGVVVLEIKITSVPKDANALEVRLTNIAKEYANLEDKPFENYNSPAWVGRIALLRANRSAALEGWVSRTVRKARGLGLSENPVPGWLDRETHEVALRGIDNEVEVRAAAGWGNSAIYGWDDLDQSARAETLCGLIDAQVLWAEIHSVHERITKEAKGALTGDNAGSDQKDILKFLDDLEHFSSEMASHNLASDELALTIQGNRRAAGRAWLRSWDYELMASQVERRLQSFNSEAERRNAKFQVSVHRMLLVLGGLVLFDLIFSMVAAAYGGGTNAFPDAGWPGVLWFARSFRVEVLLGIALVIVVIIWWRVSRLGKRRAPDAKGKSTA